MTDRLEELPDEPAADESEEADLAGAGDEPNDEPAATMEGGLVRL
jgi:hypothetical protein